MKDNRDSFVFCSLRASFGKLSSTGLHDQIKEIGCRAGIPVEKLHPHNFRHTRATHLSEHLTEAQLKEYFGWTKSSTMTSVYTHLSGKDIDNSILKLNGIEVQDQDEEDRLKTIRCPRCKEIQDSKARYCFKCGLPLNEKAATSEVATFNDALSLIDEEALIARVMQKLKEESHGNK
ncbi:Tyrosine recombinase XerD [bioreactor metagenome]|uniref:Tyrosine recombinase XerD n=1 Tax=bioreactor metagenome TaxID=1076179 RepID=A0A645A732_9ZZZZ